MPVKSWNAGDVLAAGDLNVWTVPIAVVKPGGTSRNTTTAVADDPDLIVPVAASSTYEIKGVIFYDGALMAAPGDPGGLKWTFTVPASATGQYVPFHDSASAIVTGVFTSNWTDTNTADSRNTTTSLCVAITGILAVAGTAGNLTFRWAQVNSSGTNTRVEAQSYLTAQRIA